MLANFVEQSFLATFSFATILFGHGEHLHEVYAKPVRDAVRGSMIFQRRNIFFFGGEIEICGKHIFWWQGNYFKGGH